MSTRPYHHNSDGTFRNPEGSPRRDAPVTEYLKFFAGRVRQANEPRLVPAGFALPQETARDAWHRAGDDERLLWLGHAAFLFRMGGRTVLLDPFLGTTAGPRPFGPKRFVPPGLTVSQLPPIDALILTHNHYDHLDAWTIARLPHKDRVDVVAPLGLGAFFSNAGFRSVRDLDWYESYVTGDLAITSVPAIHWSKRGLRDECRSLWCGYVLESKTHRVYVSGDTAFGPVFDEIGERIGGFNLGLAGIGAYEPRSVMHASHATPDEAAALLRAARAHRVMGMHWGSIVLSEEDPFEPPVRFRAAAVAQGYDGENLIQAKIGETVLLGGSTFSGAGQDLNDLLVLRDQRGE